MVECVHALRLIRSVEGAGGWSRECPAAVRVGFRAMRPPAGARAVAWLETGTASPHQECPPRRPLLIEEDSCSSLGSIRTRDHTPPSAIDGDEQLVDEFRVARIADNASGCWVGGGVRAASVGDRGRDRSRRVVVAAARRCGRDGARCAGDAVGAGAAARHEAARTRPTPTMPVPPRSSRCGTATCVRRRRGPSADLAAPGAPAPSTDAARTRAICRLHAVLAR